MPSLGRWLPALLVVLARLHAPHPAVAAAEPRPKDVPYLRTLRDRELDVREVDRRVGEVRIFVYEAPAHLKAALDLDARPQAKEYYFYIETVLLKLLRQKSGKIATIVTNPETADFFWVPNTLYVHKGSDEYVHHALLPFLDHIVHDYPYFNRSRGNDHIFVYVWDNGPICDTGPVAARYQFHPTFQRVVHPMIIVGYHGMLGYRSPHRWAHPQRDDCFWIGHDITLPQLNTFYKKRRSFVFSPQFLRDKAVHAVANFYYSGTIYSEGIYCSTRIRVWVYHYMQTCDGPPFPAGDSNRSCAKARTCTDQQHVGVFALCPAGWGCWSSRLYDAIDRMELPLIVSDGMVQPFERWFDWASFTVKVMSGNMAHLVKDGHHLQQETHFNSIRFPTMERLHEDAVSFRRACLPCDRLVSSEASCVAHPVSRKLRALSVHRPWFSWDVHAPKNALKLFVLELHCRSVRGRLDPLCKPLPRSDFTAWAEYGV
eukprot:EG_transcript_8684